MTNKLAVWIGAAIVAAILGDILFNGSTGMTFLLRKFADFVEYLMFWR